MLGLIRTFLGTRISRVFFVILIVPFVLWGVADVVRNLGRPTALATVGDRRIELPEFQSAYRQRMPFLNTQLGGPQDLTPERQRLIAGIVLQQLIGQQAVAAEVERLGLTVPDEAVRQAVFDDPNLRGLNGAYDPGALAMFLRRSGMTQARYIEQVRFDLARQQIGGALQAGAQPPASLVAQRYQFERETRIAELVDLPISAAPDPEAPTDVQLHDAYANDPQRYAIPAYRTVKLVVLSVDTAARRIDVPDADVAADYEQHQSVYATPEKRSADILIAPDEATAQKLADQWKAGATWPDMQKAAGEVHASDAHLDEVEKSGTPSPDLGEALFAATPDAVSGPVKGIFGWQVLRVGKVVPAVEQPLTAVSDEIRAAIQRERATDQLPILIRRLDDTISAGNTLEQIDADSGAEVTGGTLDANGLTATGEPAPLPGSAALRPVLIRAAFTAPLNQPLRLQDGPEGSVFAVTVTAETTPEVRPYEAAAADVRANWLRDTRLRSEEEIAAKLLAAVQGGKSLDEAATAAGVAIVHTPPIARASRVDGVPPGLRDLVFALKPGEARMLSAPDRYTVIRLETATSPDMAADEAGAQQVRARLSGEMAQDLSQLFAMALSARAAPQVNRQLLDQAVQ